MVAHIIPPTDEETRQLHLDDPYTLGKTLLTVMGICLLTERDWMNVVYASTHYAQESYALWQNREWHFYSNKTDEMVLFDPLHDIHIARLLVDWLMMLPDPMTEQQKEAQRAFYLTMRAYNEWVHTTEELCHTITVAFLEAFGYTAL